MKEYAGVSYALFGNGASKNHGCEAIIRGTIKLLKNNPVVLSENADEDKTYGIDQIAEIIPAKRIVKKNYDFADAYLRLKIRHDYSAMDCLPYYPSIDELSKKISLAFSVGGDNYCYSGQEKYGYLNNRFIKNGVDTVLWGCSVEPEVVHNEKIRNDLNKYRLIVARESITYDALRSIGARVVLAPDPAFFMDAEKCGLPFEDKKDTIGINISPMIISNEKINNIAVTNYLNLIQYILDNTDCNIALIPHVVWPQNDDRKINDLIAEKFGNNPRIAKCSDHTAPELKYIIGRCRYFIGARTHSTIAAYSQLVPTIVIGYSVKAKGIARDIFGSEENYVLPVQELYDECQLTDKFKCMIGDEINIKTKLKEYCMQGFSQMDAAIKEIGYF